VSNLRK